ncbi:hypothetical protein [Aeromonas sobria]|nr:hypothetical protein [Aeromonas sobria]
MMKSIFAMAVLVMSLLAFLLEKMEPIRINAVTAEVEKNNSFI